MTDPYALMVNFYDEWSGHMSEDIPFYVARALEAAPGPIVELGAGNGRVAIEIARAGVEVIAVEPSAPMRADGERRAADARVSGITFVAGDMRTFVADPPVDLVIIPFRAFQHLLDVQDQLRALSAIHDSLRSGGRCILNVFTLDPWLVAERDGVRAHRMSFVDPAGQRHDTYSTPRNTLATQRLDVTIEDEVWEGDRMLRREEAELRLRMIGRYEMEHLFARTGFEVIALAGGFAGEEYGPGPDEMVWTARRP